MDRLQEFIQGTVVPEADRWDVDQQIPGAALEEARSLGLWGALIDGENGGSLAPATQWGDALEKIGYGSMSLLSVLTVHTMCAQAIGRWGDAGQRERWLPAMAAGKCQGAYALSEPAIGSDASHVESRMEASGGDWVLNGRKRWISAAQIADIFLVLAMTDEGPTAVIVPHDAAGLQLVPIEGMLGFRSAMMAEIVFHDVRVSRDQVIGPVGMGFSHVTNAALDAGRFCIACGCAGLIRACVQASVDYARTRKQFGAPLREHQLIQEMIADMATAYKASRALWQQAAALRDQGDPRSITETTTAKYFASTSASKAANDTVQIHGANGCGPDYPVQRYFRDARICEIIEGSNQMQQILIAHSALSEFRSPRKRPNR